MSFGISLPAFHIAAYLLLAFHRAGFQSLTFHWVRLRIPSFHHAGLPTQKFHLSSLTNLTFHLWHSVQQDMSIVRIFIDAPCASCSIDSWPEAHELELAFDVLPGARSLVCNLGGTQTSWPTASWLLARKRCSFFVNACPHGALVVERSAMTKRSSVPTEVVQGCRLSTEKIQSTNVTIIPY